MSLILDILCVLLIWVMGAKGYKKGLVKGLFGVLSFVLSGFITAIIYKPVSEYIMNITFVKNNMASLGDKISSLLSIPAQEEISKLPHWLYDTAYKTSEAANTAVTNAAVTIIVNIFCIVVICLLVKVALRLFEGVFGIIMKLPILNLVNKSGGMICGIITSVAVLWIVLAVVVLFAGTEIFKPINEAIQETSVLKYFYNNNLLMKMIIK
jgi:uncharacterized membrane protein required for colicin V production